MKYTEMSIGIQLKQSRSGQSGQIMVMVVFMLIALLALVGLVVDGGGLYFLERDGQNAVDAAALAAAERVCAGSTDEVIEERANYILEQHGFQDGVDGDATNVDIFINDDGVKSVRVDLTAHKENFFIRIVDDSDLSVGVAAVSICDDASSPYSNHAIVGTGSNCTQPPAVSVQGGGTVDGILGNGGRAQISGAPVVVEGVITIPRGSVSEAQGWDGAPFKFMPGVSLNGYTADRRQYDYVQWTEPRELELLYDIDWFNANSADFIHIRSLTPEQALEEYGTEEAWRVVNDVQTSINNNRYVKLYDPGQFQPGNELPAEGLVYVDYFKGSSHPIQVADSFTLAIASHHPSKRSVDIGAQGHRLGEPEIPGIAVISWSNGSELDVLGFPTASPTTDGNCSDGLRFGVGGNGTRWNGLVYVPFGKLQMGMSNAEVYGQIIAYSVHVATGSGQFRFQNDFLESGDQFINLVE